MRPFLFIPHVVELLEHRERNTRREFHFGHLHPVNSDEAMQSPISAFFDITNHIDTCHWIE